MGEPRSGVPPPDDLKRRCDYPGPIDIRSSRQPCDYEHAAPSTRTFPNFPFPDRRNWPLFKSIFIIHTESNLLFTQNPIYYSCCLLFARITLVFSLFYSPTTILAILEGYVSILSRLSWREKYKSLFLYFFLNHSNKNFTRIVVHWLILSKLFLLFHK